MGFGLCAMVLMLPMAFMVGGDAAIGCAESRHYTEPLFVFVVMVVAASKPILETARAAIAMLARALPLRTVLVQVWLCLAAAPLFGSLITEPAAIPLAALMLAPVVFRHEVPEKLRYAALGALFVNISIGGMLTSYAAPSALMVASAWNWDTAFMLETFG